MIPSPLVRRAALTLTAAALALPTLFVSPPPALGETAETGTLVSPRDQTQLTQPALVSASPDYVIHKRQQYDEIGVRTFSVVRVSDGVTVNTFDQLSSSQQPPTMSGHSYLIMTRSASALPGRVDVYDDETGAREASIDITGHDYYVHGDEQWAMVDDVGVDTGHNTVSIVGPDGSTTAVDSNFDAVPHWVGGNDTTAYVTAGLSDFEIDTATGRAHQIRFADPSARLYAVGPTTLIGMNTYSVNDQEMASISLADRTSGADLGTLDVPYPIGGFFLAYGNGLAGLYREAGSAIYYDLRPIDMTTGAPMEPVAEHVLDAEAMGNGQIALAIADVPTGRIAVAPGSSSTVQPVTNLPTIAYQAADLGLSGDTVAASWVDDKGIWTIPLDGSSSWSDTYPAPSFADNQGRPISIAGEVALTQTRGYNLSTFSGYRLQWPGGSRDFDAIDAALGHGGTYILVRAPSAINKWTVEDARTGVPVATFDYNTHPVVDGRWLWTAPDASGVMEGTDLAKPARTRSVSLGSSCANAHLRDVRGRWALLDCSQREVVDLGRALDPFVSSYTGTHELLGNGFLAWADYQTSEGDYVLHVTDLSAGHVTRTYGSLGGDLTPLGPVFAVNDAGWKDLVYIDTERQVRHVDLGWLGSAPPPVDGTAPTLQANAVLAPVTGSKVPVTVQPAWRFDDIGPAWEPQSGTASYDIRWRAQGSHEWSMPASWQALTTATVTASIQSGAGKCFSARARDAAGNLSDWSPTVCEYVDGAAPVPSRATGSPAYPASVHPALTYHWMATDDSGIVSYDVAMRTAPRGQQLGAWWTVRAATTTTWLKSGPVQPGVEKCFRFRATDRAGNSSTWTHGRCSATPVDDGAFTTRGRVASSTWRGAIAGDYTKLLARGSSATLQGQTGRTIGLWVIRAPGQGVADVYAGGRRVGSVSFNATNRHRALVKLRVTHGFAGAVRVVARGSRPVDLDAIAVMR